jgi:hypothetical protein
MGAHDSGFSNWRWIFPIAHDDVGVRNLSSAMVPITAMLATLLRILRSCIVSIAMGTFTFLQGADMKMTDSGLPLLIQPSEEDGFVDMLFKISDIKTVGDRLTFTLRADHKGKIVGFNVSIDTKINEGIANGALKKEAIVKDGVIFRSSGADSDELVRAIAELYKVDADMAQMVAEEKFTAFALMDKPFDVTKGIFKLKIFGRDQPTDGQDDYYESFLNVDTINGFVSWNQKDIDYRKPLIKSLAKKNSG